MHITDIISSHSLSVTIFGGILLIIFVLLSLVIKKPTPLIKKLLFSFMVLDVIFVTLFLIISTIYLNFISISKGPVHYHADIEIWACGNEIDIEDPEGLSNKIGTPILHEHNDKRIHLEGVVVEESDASLGRFFNVIGGELSTNFISIPTNEGQVNFISGTTCPNGQIGTVQVFVYKTINNNFYQQKIDNPQNYIIEPSINVPPGDCIIVEFSEEKEKTDKICQSFEVSQQTGKLKGEIEHGH